MNKRTAAAAISVSLIGGTALGASVLGPWTVGAQSTTSTTAAQSTPSTPQAPDSANPALPEDREAEITARLSERLQSLVDDGTITDAQRDAVVAKLVENGPMDGFGDGMGHGPRGGFLGRSDVLTDLLGLTEDELRQELSDGSSIADIAAEQGVELQTVIDALVTEATDKLDEAVTAGRITQAQADDMKAEITTHITAMVNGEMPTPPMGDGEGRPFGPRGPRPGGEGTTTSTTGA